MLALPLQHANGAGGHRNGGHAASSHTAEANRAKRPPGPVAAPAEAPTAPPVDHTLPTLDEAVAALPLTGSGDLTRAIIAPLAEGGDLAGVLLRCVDSLDQVQEAMELLRPGYVKAELPPVLLEAGLGALLDCLQDQLARVALLVRGASGEAGC